jgi:DNA mismatch endonuclease (patch repair protein)
MDPLSPQQRSRIMSRVRNRDTLPERLIRSMLHRHGYRFRLHRKDIPGTPDIVFPGRRSVILVHGCFWHGHDCPRGRPPSSNREFWNQKISVNKRRDALTVERLAADGWNVLTVWQCEIKDLAQLEKTLIGFLGPPSRQHRG